MVEALSNLVNQEFSAFVALAFLLYAIRRATKVSKKYLPVIGVVLGIALAAFEEMAFNFEVVMTGVKYAIYAVVLVFGGKFAQIEFNNRRNRNNQETNLGNQQTRANVGEADINNTNEINNVNNSNDMNNVNNSNDMNQTSGNSRPNVNQRY